MSLPTFARRLIASLLAAVVVGAILGTMAHVFSEAYALDCQRPSPDRVDCVAHTHSRYTERAVVMNANSLRRADVHQDTVRDADGQMETRYHLRLVHTDGARTLSFDSANDAQRDHAERARRINAFLADPTQRSLVIRFDNRTALFGMAALTAVFAAVAVWFFTRG